MILHGENSDFRSWNLLRRSLPRFRIFTKRARTNSSHEAIFAATDADRTQLLSHLLVPVRPRL